MSIYKKYHFVTLTVNQWISVFQDFPLTNQIILGSFNHVANTGLIKIHAFVIMRDHLHFICSPLSNNRVEEVILGIKKYTGRTLCKILYHENDEYLKTNFLSDRKDRKYKFWKIGNGNLQITNLNILWSKINYIHMNPTKGDYKVTDKPESYYFSSASSYKIGIPIFSFLSLVKINQEVGDL